MIALCFSAAPIDVDGVRAGSGARLCGSYALAAAQPTRGRSAEPARWQLLAIFEATEPTGDELVTALAELGHDGDAIWPYEALLEPVSNERHSGGRPRHVLTVFSNPAEGHEDEYLEWYHGTHMDHMMGMPGFTQVGRFVRVDGVAGATPNRYRYLSIYYMDADDLAAALHEMHLQAVGEKPGMDIPAHVNDPVYASWTYSGAS